MLDFFSYMIELPAFTLSHSLFLYCNFSPCSLCNFFKQVENINSMLFELASTVQQEIEGLEELMKISKMITSLEVGCFGSYNADFGNLGQITYLFCLYLIASCT